MIAALKACRFFLCALGVGLCLVTIPAGAQEPVDVAAEIARIEADLDEKLAAIGSDKRAAIDRYLSAVDVNNMFDQMMSQMTPAVVAHVQSLNPELPEGDVQTFIGAMTEYLGENFEPLIVKLNVASLGEAFTTEEVAALADFYESEVGRTVMEKLPKLMQDTTALVLPLNEMMVPLALEHAQGVLESAGSNVRL